MKSRLLRLAQPAVSALRPSLNLRERLLLDLLLAAGSLGGRLFRAVNLRQVSGPRDPRRRLAPLLESIRRKTKDSRRSAWTAARNRLARRLARHLARPGEIKKPLGVLITYAGGGLAPDGLPPSDPLLAAAFGTAVRVFSRLYPSGVHPLGRLSFVGPRRLAELLAETRVHVRRGRKSSGRRPGLKGRELAVDPRLMAAVGRKVRYAVAPGFEARYLFYSKPGDFFWPHPDDPMYHVNVLLCLERTLPADGGRPSCFYAYDADGALRRVDLKPGGALAVEARGVLHGREPLRRGERVTLLSIELLTKPR